MLKVGIHKQKMNGGIKTMTNGNQKVVIRGKCTGEAIKGIVCGVLDLCADFSVYDAKTIETIQYNVVNAILDGIKTARKEPFHGCNTCGNYENCSAEGSISEDDSIDICPFEQERINGVFYNFNIVIDNLFSESVANLANQRKKKCQRKQA